MVGNMDLSVRTELETLKEMLNESKIEKITQEDLLKRKRVKNFVPYFDRCIGKNQMENNVLVNGDQIPNCVEHMKRACLTVYILNLRA